MFVYRNAYTIVLNNNGGIAADSHLDAVASAGKSFIDRVIDDLIHQVMQRLGVRPTHVHAGSAAHGL
jgi:ribosomal protein S19E (S16A)